MRSLQSNEITRKIIHIDMDCFFAAIEIRDNPSLKNKSVAVGGAANKRGVICTANYVARKYGIHSAMATAYAKRSCPNLIIIPTDIAKYKKASFAIHKILSCFTNLIEPLSLDEAYLDVTNSPHFQGSATLIAKEIKKRIFKQEKLIASAGIAPNKLLAKIASDWKKPDGLFVIHPDQIKTFIEPLPVNKLFGVGNVTANKLTSLGVKTCQDLQNFTLEKLIKHFGSFGLNLYYLSRGIDNRKVEPGKKRKSLSIERTFPKDLSQNECQQIIDDLYQELAIKLQNKKNFLINKQFIKIKFGDFKSTTVECLTNTISKQKFRQLLITGLKRHINPVRLIGIGVRFANNNLNQQQLSLLS